MQTSDFWFKYIVGTKIPRISLDWEDQFVEVALNSSSATTSVIPNASKSFADISSKAIFFDAFLMAGGYLIMFAYTILMLGKLNRLQVLFRKKR